MFSHCRSTLIQISALILWVIAIFCVSMASAVENRCLSHQSKGVFGGELGYGRNVNTDFFEPFHRLLFLSDANAAGMFGYRNEVRTIDGGFSIGQAVAQVYPGKEVIQTDFNVKSPTTYGNHRIQFMDNTKLFPFLENIFDFIGMRKGLCLCSCRSPCGGFGSKYQQSFQFFSEVVRVLNKNNPRSMAILHGQEFWNPKVVKRWRRISEELESLYGVEVFFAYAPEGWTFAPRNSGPEARPEIISKDNHIRDFNAIIIRPKSDLPLELPAL